MPATTPPTITALPAPPDPNDRSTFNALAYPWSTAQQTMATQMGALASNVYSNAQAAEAAATAADLDAAAAAADKIAAAGSATTATTQNGQAQTAATTATNQAGIASTQRGLAETAATTATTQAGAATTALASAAAITLGVASGHPTLRPTLNLNFAQARSVDPRITFTRASTATRTNSRGLIESVATGTPRIDFDPITLACRGLLVEESRTNLLTYSQDFDNAAGWSKSGSSIAANSTVAPDGSATADRLTEDTATAAHLTYQQATITANTAHTVTVYAKSDTRTRFKLYWANTANTTGANVDFDLSSGTASAISVYGTGAAYSATISSAGNGWYRCSLSGVIDASSTLCRMRIDILNAAGAFSYTGDGTSGIYIWGAQLEAGSFPTSYIPSTVTHTGRASTATFIGSNGLIQTAASGAARYSYNPINLSAAPALLLEESRTNLTPSSGWGALSGTGTFTDSTATTAPDGTTTYIKAAVWNDVSSYTGSFPTQATSTNTFTASLYVKNNGGSVFGLSVAFGGGTYLRYGMTYNFSTGAITTTGSPSAATATDAGGGWVRLSISGANNGSVGNTQHQLLIGFVTGSVNAYVWGAQLEQGAYATSFIPANGGVAVTRAADTSTSATTTRSADFLRMTGANFSSWYRQDEGTFVVSGGSPHNQPASTWPRLFDVNDGTYMNQMANLIDGQWDRIVHFSNLNASLQASSFERNFAYLSGTANSALAYKVNDFAGTVGGLTPFADSTFAIPVVNSLCIGTQEGGGGSFLNGHIRSLRYYPKRLTNTELQTLTQE